MMAQLNLINVVWSIIGQQNDNTSLAVIDYNNGPQVKC